MNKIFIIFILFLTYSFVSKPKIINPDLSVNFGISDSTVGLIVKGKNYYDVFCTGSIISKKYVLTSAHCVESLTVSDFFIAIGPIINTKLSLNQVSKPAKIHIHEGYKGIDNDIALIEINKPFSENLRPISIIKNNLINVENLEYTVAGYSTYTQKIVDNIFLSFGLERKEKYKEVFGRDRHGNLTIGLNSKKVLQHNSTSSGNLISIYQIDGGICPGDSGGPTMIKVAENYFLKGINTSVARKFLSSSEEFDCEYMAMSTDVSAYEFWIKSIDDEANFIEVSKEAISSNQMNQSRADCFNVVDKIFKFFEDEIVDIVFFRSEDSNKCSRLVNAITVIENGVKDCFVSCLQSKDLYGYCSYVERSIPYLKSDATKKVCL